MQMIKSNASKIILAMLAFIGLLLAYPSIAEAETLQSGSLKTPASSNSIERVSIDNYDIYSQNNGLHNDVEGANYNPDTNTLTFNGFNRTFNANSYCIEIIGNNVDSFTINLNGDNYINWNNNECSNNPIYVTGINNLIINGTGSLNTDSVYGGTIYSKGNIIVESGFINSKSVNDCAIISGGKITLKNNCKVSAQSKWDKKYQKSILYRTTIWAKNGMSNSYTNLGIIRGYLPCNAEFKTKQGIWQVDKKMETHVGLKKWLGGKTANLGYFNYNSAYFAVNTIYGNAFNTPEGKKVKKISLSGECDYIRNYAFAGTSSLKLLDLNYSDILHFSIGKYNIPKKIVNSVNKKAFAGMGKGKNGSGMKVKICKMNKKERKMVRKLFLKKGMPKKVKF